MGYEFDLAGQKLGHKLFDIVFARPNFCDVILLIERLMEALYYEVQKREAIGIVDG